MKIFSKKYFQKNIFSHNYFPKKNLKIWGGDSGENHPPRPKTWKKQFVFFYGFSDLFRVFLHIRKTFIMLIKHRENKRAFFFIDSVVLRVSDESFLLIFMRYLFFVTFKNYQSIKISIMFIACFFQCTLWTFVVIVFQRKLKKAT